MKNKLCPPDNQWLNAQTWPGAISVHEVVWVEGLTGERHEEGKALHIVISLPHGKGVRQVQANVAVTSVVDALLNDPDAAAVVLTAVAARLGEVLAA